MDLTEYWNIMHKTLKFLIAGLVMLSSVSVTYSQKRTASPFSRYGLGELNYQGFGRNNAMGGTGIGVRSPLYLNSMNPATYSAGDSLAFLFDTGLETKIQNFKTSNGSQRFSDVNFDYFAMGFSLGKRGGMIIGLKPASNAGYLFESKQVTNGESSVMHMEGSGNISNLYGGIAYDIMPNLSVGLNANIWFGELNHTTIHEFADDDNSYLYGIRTKHHMADLILDFGAQYTKKLDEERSLVFGAVFRPETNVKGESSLFIARGFSFASDDGLFVNPDTLVFKENEWTKSAFQLPMKVGIGASYNIVDKLTLAADASFENWAESKFPDENTETANVTFVGLGAEYIPNYRSPRKYYEIVRYRAGINYRENYIKLDGQQVKGYGISFGLGLPLGRTKTTVNIGYEFTALGTGNSSQLKERVNRLSLSFTMHESWFFKRQFD